MGLGEYWYRLVYWCRLGNNGFNRNFKLHILTSTIFNVLVTLNNFNKSIGRRSTLTGNHLRSHLTQYVHQDINFHERCIFFLHLEISFIANKASEASLVTDQLLWYSVYPFITPSCIVTSTAFSDSEASLRSRTITLLQVGVRTGDEYKTVSGICRSNRGIPSIITIH